MAREKLFHIGVKGVIKNSRSEILLLYADVSKFDKPIEPYWDIPGGRIQKNDSILSTLRREILEETGLKAINPVFKASVMSNHEIPLDSGEHAGLLLMVYVVNAPESASITLSEEHIKYGWFEVSDAKALLKHKYPADFIAQL